MTAEIIKHDGVEWIEIGKAARLSRTKADAILDLIAAGSVRSVELDGRTYITVAAKNRLRREATTMIGVGQQNRKDRSNKRAPSRPSGLKGQDVLPMSSGRKGTGWLGQLPRK